MNVRYFSSANFPEEPAAVPLAGVRGELHTVSITIDPRDLEHLLDRLGESQYPIDPQIYHDVKIDGRTVTVVEFPAWAGWLEEIRALLTLGTSGGESLTIRKCLTHGAAN